MARWGICFLMGIVMIQYMPNMKCGIFWWTSVAHYCIPYGLALVCMGWSLRWLESGCKRFMCGMLIGMSYLGGAGYPEVVLAAVWFFFVPWIVLHAFRRRIVTRGFWLWLPLAVEMVGFAVSAAAPGNKNRGGAEFGFSVSKVVWTLAACIREGITETGMYFVRVRILLPALVLIVLLLLIHCGEIRLRKIAENWKSWGIAGVLGFAIVCLVRAPVLYAGTDASGGVPDSYWFITIVAAVAWLEVFLTPDVSGTQKCEIAKNPRMSKQGKSIQASGASGNTFANELLGKCSDKKKSGKWMGESGKVYVMLTAAMAVFLVVFSKHFVGGSVDYTCVQFIRSGALADYHEQMEEWLDILNDPDVADAELPEMNDEQGPFMLMVPLDDPEAWSSQVYARYYGKRSVVCVPRS